MQTKIKCCNTNRPGEETLLQMTTPEAISMTVFAQVSMANQHPYYSPKNKTRVCAGFPVASSDRAIWGFVYISIPGICFAAVVV